MFVSDAAVFSLNVVRTLLAISLRTFFIKGKPVFNAGPSGITKNPSDLPIIRNLVFISFVLADDLFPKKLQKFKTCVLKSALKIVKVSKLF